MGGNTREFLSGWEIVPPDLTESITCPIDSSTTALPAVFPVISSACMIGTPAAVSEDSVRDHRASATFCTTSPIFIGIRNLIRSHCARPVLVPLHLKNETTTPTQTTRTMSHWCPMV